MDDHIPDHEIGPLWTEHYPKRLNDPRSKVLRGALCLIIQNKAGKVADEDSLLDGCIEYSTRTAYHGRSFIRWKKS